ERVCFSPDGRRLASGSWATIKVWDPTATQEAHTFISDPRACWDAAFTPEGHLLALTRRAGSLRVFDVRTGQDRFVRDGQLQQPRGRLSPHGRWLASVGAEGVLTLSETTTGHVLRLPHRPEEKLVWLFFSPDERRVGAKIVPGKTLKVWDTGTGQEIVSFSHE